jgi:hypothetical protein
MRRIVECDACAGLPEEAHALAAVTDAYSRLPNPDVAKFHATLRKANITAHGGNIDFAAAARQKLSAAAASKLWRAFLLLVEFHHGNLMDERREAEAINLMGRECASIYKQNAVAGEALQSSLLSGLTVGTSDEEHFMKGYTQALQQLAVSANQPVRQQ